MKKYFLSRNNCIKQAVRMGLFLLPILLLTGCGGEPAHTTEQVRDYIRESVTTEAYEFVEAPKSSEEHMWKIRLKDDSGLEIRIYDEISYDLFSSSYYLYDDYAAVAAAYEAPGILDRLDLEMEISEDDRGLQKTLFTGTFSDRSTMNDLLDRVEKLTDYLQKSEHPCAVTVKVLFAHPLRQVEEAKDIADDGDYELYAITEVKNEQREEVQNRMVLLSKSLGYDYVLADFSRQEILDTIAQSNQCIGVCHGNPDRDSYEYHEDICGSRYRSCVSLGTLYELLKKEGYEVTGDGSDYSFRGADGNEYRVLYDWSKGKEGIALLQNGYELETRTWGHVYYTEIEEMTGLHVRIWKMNDQPNANVYTEDGHLRCLDMIRLNGEEMTYDTCREGRYLNTTDDYRFVYYDEDRECYMIIVDIGFTSKSSSYPVIWQEWVSALWGTYEREKVSIPEKILYRGTDQYKTKWSIGPDQYVMRARMKDNEIVKLELWKNRNRQLLEYATRTDAGYVGASFCVAIPVDTFADLLNLTYEIDEEEGSINYYN